MKQTLAISALAFFVLTGANPAHAQNSEDNKQALVQRVLALWHIEDAGITMAQRPATEALLQARVALQGRVSAQKQEATLKDIVADVQKYIDDATPIVRAEGMRLKAPTLGPLLLQNFSEDELRMLIALFESPVKKKFESLVPQFERSFGEKVAENSRSAIDPKIQALTKEIGIKMRAAMMSP
jgi:hypothetical protein